MKHGKTVLVVDDFCTQGNSFEAARAFIRATGAQVVCAGGKPDAEEVFARIKGAGINASGEANPYGGFIGRQLCLFRLGR
jgi:orotate phosphoribosyltransferase